MECEICKIKKGEIKHTNINNITKFVCLDCLSILNSLHTYKHSLKTLKMLQSLKDGSAKSFLTNNKNFYNLFVLDKLNLLKI